MNNMTGDYSRYKKIDIGRAKVGLFYIVQIVNIYDYETDIYKYEIYTHTYTYICVNMHIYIFPIPYCPAPHALPDSCESLSKSVYVLCP